MVTFWGYGLAIAPFSYLMSFAFSKHTHAQILCLVINFVTGLFLMITSYILSMIDDTKELNDTLLWLYRVFPGFCLGHGLLSICTNSLASSAFDLDGDIDLLGWDVAGKDVAYLYCSAPFYFMLVLLVDYVIHSPLAALSRHFDPRVSDSCDFEDDRDVAAESQRVARGGANDDVVRVDSLRKIYRTPEGVPKVAVSNLSFGVPRGECFGFLGSNGAGKTSTLNMLTGVVLPSAGSATIGGHDVVSEQHQVRRLLGYCPQHDALLDRLTVREHLELFGRIKCIPRPALRGYCDRMMRALDLTDHVDQMAMALSGGNKRKLSLAIAMMSSPPLVLLDEPSTGVDPAARRLMWNVISAASTEHGECSVMLTTHNMEEAEALCSRLGIMVNGRLQCIGSNQHLKARYGSGYQLEARIKCPDDRDVQTMLSRWKLPVFIPAERISDTCSEFGNPRRAALIRDEQREAHMITDALQRENRVPARVFVQFWLMEDFMEEFTQSVHRSFPDSRLLERQDRILRYLLPARSKLCDIFSHFERQRQELHIEEYGVSQATLEQIFNGFAARQSEERAL